MRRLAAAAALVALLLCSSAGTCWAQLVAATRSHACCEGRDAMATPERPCSSRLAPVAPVVLVPPSEATLPRIALATAGDAVAVAAFGPSLHVLAPPLVLRI